MSGKSDNPKQAAKRKSLPEVLRLNLRAMRLIYRRYPHLILSGQLVAIWRALPAYVNISFSAQILEELAGNRDKNRLLLLILLTLTINALLSLVDALLTRYKTLSTNLFFHKVRKILGEKQLDMDYSILEKPETAEKVNHIWQLHYNSGWGLINVAGRFEAFTQAFISLFVGIALVVSLFTSKVPQSAGPLTVLNSPLFLVGLVAALLLLTWAAPFFITKSQGIWASQASQTALGNRIMGFYGNMGRQEQGAEDIRIYRQDRFGDKFYKDKTGYWCSKGSYARLCRGSMGLYRVVASAIPALFTGLIYGFVGLKALGGAFGVGMMTQYIRVISRFSDNISSLLRSWGFLRNNAPFLENVFDFLDIPNEMSQGSLPLEREKVREYEIEFRDVSFCYPGSTQYALRHVNVKFQAGKCMAVVGENGSGKTTFIKLLCRLYDPTEGQILLNGIDIRKYDHQQYLDFFSVVFQDFQLTNFSLAQNVSGSDEYDARRIVSCLRRAGLGERLEELPEGIESYYGTHFHPDGIHFSGGEAQKIAIARALYKDAPFIILDEPTASLDPIAEAEVYSKFNGIVQDKTAIYISHRLSSCRFCDEILVFQNGFIVQQGSHKELLTDRDGKYSQLWFAQAQYYSGETG